MEIFSHICFFLYVLTCNLMQQINVGDVLCDIETDKATLEFESLEEG